MEQPPAFNDKDTLIAELLKQNTQLVAQNATLLGRIEELAAQVARLEAKSGKPPKTPDNSSVPPSRGNKPSGSSQSKPKGKPHCGVSRALHPNPTRTLEVLAQTCRCGTALGDVAQHASESYDRIEIPDILPDVTRVVLHGGICPCCARRFKAEPPAGMAPGSPFGGNLRAFVLYLRSVQAIPLARLRRVLLDLFGLEISEGALVNILAASQTAFAAQADRIKADLKTGTVLASDETGMRVSKANHWLWIFHHRDSAVFVADPHRSKSVVQTFLGDFRPDYWISDRFGSQKGWATREHQFCIAHLIRDVQYAIDSGDNVLGPAVRKLLKRACGIGRRREALQDTTLKSYGRQLDDQLSAILKRIPDSKPGWTLLKILKKVRHNLFVFVTNRELTATNNGSERGLRPCVIYRKVTNGFRSTWAVDHYANLRSVIETGRRRSISALDAIRLTLAGRTLRAPV